MGRNMIHLSKSMKQINHTGSNEWQNMQVYNTIFLKTPEQTPETYEPHIRPPVTTCDNPHKF